MASVPVFSLKCAVSSIFTEHLSLNLEVPIRALFDERTIFQLSAWQLLCRILPSEPLSPESGEYLEGAQ